MTKKITVLLVDDHALVRRGFRRLIEDEPDIHVLGEADDGDAAVRLSKELNPRIVLMDYSLPGIDGLMAARQIVGAQPATFIVMLSMHSSDVRIRQAQEAGVRGYLEKNADYMELVSIIRRVAKGERVFPREMSGETEGAAKPDVLLSDREREILQLIVQGQSNRQIAERLALSVHTVGAHRANIMRTLDIHRVADLAAYAIRKGLVRDTS